MKSGEEPPVPRTRSEAILNYPASRIITACLLGLFCGGGFAASSLFNQHRFLVREAPHFATHIFSWNVPFSPSWVWVYIMYYPFCFLPLLLKPVRQDAGVFLRTVAGFGLQFAICFTFFFLWPIRMAHPQMHPGFNRLMVTHLYEMDGGFNAFPSLHVANTVFVALLFLKYHRAWTGWVLMVGAALIALSALLVQQHYIHDVVAGALVGWGSFHAAFQFMLPSRRSKQ